MKQQLLSLKHHFFFFKVMVSFFLFSKGQTPTNLKMIEEWHVHQPNRKPENRRSSTTTPDGTHTHRFCLLCIGCS
jgi:hypothetical protein